MLCLEPHSEVGEVVGQGRGRRDRMGDSLQSRGELEGRVWEWGCPVHCRVFCRSPGLFSTLHTLLVDTGRCWISSKYTRFNTFLKLC